MDIAFDLDEFFRQHDSQYAANNPDAHTAKEDIYEKLMAGRISALDEKLAALGQTENDYHHSSDDGKYLIMGNGTRAFAIPAEQPEKDNPLRTAEMTIEDDYGMIDGVINNGRRGEELERAKEKPSIRERLEDAKRECAERPKPEKQHSGRNIPEHGDL